MVVCFLPLCIFRLIVLAVKIAFQDVFLVVDDVLDLSFAHTKRSHDSYCRVSFVVSVDDIDPMF